MLFGSAAVVAILLGASAGGESTRQRTATHPRPPVHLWLQAPPRAEPMDLSRKIPIELKSAKVVGATGLGAFFPLCPDFAVGAAYTTFRLTPTHRAAQIVGAIRIRF